MLELHIIAIIFLIINRAFFIRLPLHGDIGFFANWGHFKDETLDHDLILHNGGFRSAAIFVYAFFKKILFFCSVKEHSRISQIICLLISIPGYYLLFQKLGVNTEVWIAFLVCYVIAASSSSNGSVYIYTVELFGICFLPWILLIYFLSASAWLKLAVALFLGYLFKLNVAIEVLLLYAWWYLQEVSFLSAIGEGFVGFILSLLAYLIFLKSLGILRFSWLGFKAFYRSRNDNWYAWKRLLVPSLKQILWENIPLLLLALMGIIACINQELWWPLAFFGFEILGVIIQRGFFHYHYIAVTPGLAILSAYGLATFGAWITPVSLLFLIGYTLLRWKQRNEQHWPKILEHQKLFNEIVDQLHGTKFEKILRDSKVVWHAGWRYQIYLLFDCRPFSTFLQTVKFMMVFNASEEQEFMPEFKDEFWKRMVNLTPDLLVLEENELIDLGALRKMGLSPEFIGSFRGRLSFFKLHNNQLNPQWYDQHYQELFVRPAVRFDWEYFERMCPQYLQQNKGEPIFLYGINRKSEILENYFLKQGYEIQWLDEDELTNGRFHGHLYLVSDERSIPFYNRYHHLINDNFRIFKFN